MKEYQITLNEKQIRLVAQALEQHSRMICGQLGDTYLPALEHGMMKEHYYKYKEEHPEDADKAMRNYCNVRDTVEHYLNYIKKLVWGMDSNAHHGVGYDEEADLGYEIYKGILSKFEDEKIEECRKTGEEYHGNVHTGECLKLTDEPRVIVEVLKKGKLKPAEKRDL